MPRLPHYAVTLSRLRAERGLGLRELGRATGLSPQTVANVEAGTRPPNYSTLEALARVLGVHPGIFFPPVSKIVDKS